MHPVLEVQEILNLIFMYNLTEAELCRCSLVCRLWAVWASDVLWSAKPVPLTRVLKATASVTMTSTAIRGNITALININIGKIKEAGWHRFAALSNKATRISVDCKINESSLLNIYYAKETFQGEIFGRLNTVEMATDDDVREAINLLVVPSLLEVLLLCDHMRGKSLEWAFQVLPKLAPNVRHLGLSFTGQTQLDASRYSSLVNLEVNCTYMMPSFWQGLAKCPILAQIGLCGTLDVTHWNDPWQMEYVDFPALVTFKIAFGHPRVAVQLIPRSRMPMLEHFLCDDATGVESEISTLVEEDASVQGALEGTPLDQLCSPLSDASTAVEEEDEPSPVLSLRRAGIYRHPNYRPRPIPSHPPPLDNALGLDLGPPAFFHPFDDPSQATSEPPIVEAWGPPRNSTVSLRRIDEPRYAAPAFMVAPSSLEVPTTSRMMSVRWRSRPQPDPDVVKAVWEQYTEQWKSLLESDHSLQPLLTDSRVPWPILDPTNSSVTPDDIQDLLLSSAHSTNMPMKKRIREALRLYHPDRFEKLVIERIEDEEERDTVRARAGMIVRGLNALLERET
ncbi:hypothetical protein FRB90_002960 [Tulasnella sp. 427]|nr:hypothetical protein FRB90_002960 [Tulasnella sp. 427]